MATALEAAQWMLERISSNGFLDQEEAVYAIHDKFGEEFTYINDNGNLAIAKPVLKEFKRLSGDGIVWVRGDRQWRNREDYDEPGRQQ